MPTCPYCHKELFYDEMTDDCIGDNYVYLYWRGRCFDCFRKFSWTERYDFVNFDDLEEEE